MSGHILAIGGGAILDPSCPLERYLLELAGVARPRVCFLATAVGDQSERLLGFYQAFAGRGCKLAHVELFGRPEAPAERVAEHDVIYVSGGNTANLLALWRLHAVDGAVRSVLERGGVLAGWSAGANCWFEDSVTDSFGPLRALEDGLGLVAGSVCPHYDSEEQRRPLYHRLVADGTLPAGYATDDGVGLVYRGTDLVEAVADRPDAAAYHVERTSDGTAHETIIAPRRLAD